MKNITITNLSDLNNLFSKNVYYANGKNFRIDYLYPTCANSRWNYENIYGIYLAKPQYTWMAFWMAITSRQKIRKRQIKYVHPKENDSIGSITINNPDDILLEEILCNEAYLYLFDINKDMGVLNLDQNDLILKTKFQWSKITMGENIKAGYKPLFKEPTLVDVDCWQIALTNYDKCIPIKEIILNKQLIEELKDRITFVKEEVGENYIILGEP